MLYNILGEKEMASSYVDQFVAFQNTLKERSLKFTTEDLIILHQEYYNVKLLDACSQCCQVHSGYVTGT
ncbi:MAG: hypothetical protein ACP5LN_09200 [Thermoproteota archaeon]